MTVVAAPAPAIAVTVLPGPSAGRNVTAGALRAGTVPGMAVIRALSEADLPAVFETLEPLAEQAYAGDRDDLCQNLAEAVAGDAAAVVTLDHGGRLLGVAVLRRPDPDTAELSTLWVAATHRRRGLARAMLSAFTPVWSEAAITVTVPPRADVAATGALLAQFAFTKAPTDGTNRVWRTRRVRRTTGRASLAPVRPS